QARRKGPCRSPSTGTAKVSIRSLPSSKANSARSIPEAPTLPPGEHGSTTASISTSRLAAASRTCRYLEGVSIMRQFRPALTFFASLALAACGSGEEEEAAQPATVSVRVVPAAVSDVQAWIYAQGTARAYRREFLTFASAGRVAYATPTPGAGSPGRQGQVMADQQPGRVRADVANAEAGVASAQAELTAARAAQDEARANLELARVTFERYRIL